MDGADWKYDYQLDCCWIDGRKFVPLPSNIPMPTPEVAKPQASEPQLALEHDRAKVAECVTRIKKELHSYDWLITSRGSYEWDDDKWHEEFKRASEAIWEAIEPMVNIAADWTHCPKDQATIEQARAAKPQASEPPELSDKDGWLYDPDAKLAEIRAGMAKPQPESVSSATVNTRYDNLQLVAQQYEDQINEIQQICLDAGMEEGS